MQAFTPRWNTAVIHGIYSHAMPHMQQQAAETLDAALGEYRYRPSTKRRVCGSLGAGKTWAYVCAYTGGCCGRSQLGDTRRDRVRAIVDGGLSPAQRRAWTGRMLSPICTGVDRRGARAGWP